MVNCFFNLLFLYKKKPIIRELVNNMATPYYPIQFKQLFKIIFKKKYNDDPNFEKIRGIVRGK